MVFLICWRQRRFPEALREAQAALDADPLSLPGNINMAVLLYYSNDHDRAMELCHRIGELEPTHFLNRLVTAQILARRGQHEQAIHEMEKINSAQQQHALTLRFWAELYAILGRRADAEQVLAKMIEKRQQGNAPASYIAAGWAALGDRDKAFEWLETAYRDYDGYLSMVGAAPAYAFFCGPTNATLRSWRGWALEWERDRIQFRHAEAVSPPT